MEVKRIKVGGSYTMQPVPYHPVRGEFELTVDVDEDDDLEEVVTMLQDRVTEGIKGTLANILGLHNKVEEDGKAAISGDSDDDDDDDDWL